MEKEWHKIIAFNGSQANAFEELVCQIAMGEENEKFKHFERVGTPDGGVECYWQLFANTEWGWQAKYYTSLGSSEWANVKKSLFDAVDTHPTLIKYYICLPYNLSDARRGKTTQKDTWEKNKNNWTKELAQRGRNIELEFWSSSIIFSKLRLYKNEGIKAFFFEEIEIKEYTLFNRLDAAIAALGPRYNPDLNFEIDYLPSVFNALSRNAEFQVSFKNKLDTFLYNFNEVISNCTLFEETKAYLSVLTNHNIHFLRIYEETDFSPLYNIPTEMYLDLLNEISIEIYSLKGVYSKIETKQKEQPSNAQESKYNEQPGHTNYRRNSSIEKIYEFENIIEDFSDYLKSPVLRAANEGVLFLEGKPGVGKSHLLADIALNRKQLGIPSIFLLGEQFTNQSPRIFIQQYLSPTHNLENYLKGLECLGKAKNVRILFIIDAINEGYGKHIWKHNIAGLITEFKQFRWIGFAFSYRSTYKDIIIPDNFNLPTIIHGGFEGIEYEATKAFFEFYKIQQPATPILNPEFSNPLFLKTFCITLKKSGRTTIPEGYEGISTILKEYIEAVNENIGRRLNYPYKKINLASKAVDKLIEEQIKNDSSVIAWDNAFHIIEPLLKIYSDSSGLLDELIKEGLFIEDYYYDNITHKYEQHGITFNYERFNEHLKAIYLLKNYSTVESLKRGFSMQGGLRALFFDKRGYTSFNAGLMNAFAIIIPEKYNIELHEVLKVKEGYVSSIVFINFLQSLIWRKPETIKPHTWNYVKKSLTDTESRVRFFSSILLLATHPTHYYNSNFLHKLLVNKSVAERDYMWSIVVDDMYKWNDRNTVQRIIDWCWSEEERSYAKDDSIILLGKVLAWLFTSSNRAIRDKATKAFAALFSNRTHLLPEFTEEFKSVNDPYVFERVIAGSYGAVTHSRDLLANTIFAQYIYDQFFRNRKPPLNVLTRDYCKNIVEYVVFKGGVLDYEKSNLYPPFEYMFPHDIPGENWVKTLEIHKEGQYTEEERGQAKITHSVLGWDFARYTLGTNHGSSIPFTIYPIKSRKAYESLKKALHGYKNKFFKMYVEAVTMHNGTSDLGKKIRRIFNNDQLTDALKISEETKNTAYIFLKEKLTVEEWKDFETAQAYIENGFETKKYEKKRFDVKLVQHYILKKVFDLGWDRKYFGEYDAKVDDRYRKANKPERIGKKYQWIAYYEIMALLSDNYDFFNRYNDENLPYLGTWQHNFRNIDPTAIIKQKTQEDERKINYPWWVKESYSNWNEDRSTWLDRFDDMPDFRNLVVVTNNGESWYVMHDQNTWQSSKPIGKDRYKAGRKEVWVDIKAFLLENSGKQRLLNDASHTLYWLNQQIPDNPHYYNIFLGELYFSEVYNRQIKGYYEKYPYTFILSKNKRVKAHPTAEEYGFGSEYDLSGHKINIFKPSKFLFYFLNGETGSNDACIYDKTGNIIAYDPGAYAEQSSGCLLVKKKVLDEYLLKNNLEIGWTICGEKEDIGPDGTYVYRMLYSGFIAYVDNKLEGQYHHELEK